jgi:periplasmic copper chaperone A
MKPAKIAIWTLILGLLSACGQAHPELNLLLADGWVRAVPPGSGMTAAYGKFTNVGSQAIRISGLHSDTYKDVSLHRTAVEHGISRMQPMPDWQLDPGKTTVLEPGGYHLMLMQPIREIHPGDHVRLVLTTTGGEKFEFSLPVEAR